MGILDPPPGRRLRDIATRWSRIEGLARRDEHWQARWEYFFGMYRPALIRIAAAKLPRAFASDAEDAVDAFFAESLAKDWLGRVHSAVTRSFRGWLRKVFVRFLHGYVDHRLAAKRSPRPAFAPSSLEELAESGVDVPAEEEETSESERQWAQALVDRALEKLAAANPRYARAVAEKIGRPIPEAAPDGPITPLVRHRAIQRFRHFFLATLREAGVRPDDLPDEWGGLAPYLP